MSWVGINPVYMSRSVSTVLFLGQNVIFWPWNSTVLTDLDIYTGFIPTQLWQTPVAAVTVYSAPDDGSKGRPKHVVHTCSC